MAIGAGAAGAWAVNNATTQTITLPAHAAGDLLVVIAACKASTITSVDPTITTPSTGWTRVGTFADGTVNAGNGLGSVRQAIFYKIATSGSETNPVVTWGGSQTAAPGIAVALGFTKGGGEVWLQPVVVQAATTNATSISVTMGSNPGITAGDWGIVTHTTRDDSALTVPTWTATSATLAAVVEYPATAIADGTSNDMAGDAAYRSVTSGTASAAPVCTGTQAAAETGVTGFVRLRVATAAPQTVTPTTASLSDTQFAPTIKLGVIPPVATLSTARFAPVLRDVTIVPTASLADTQFAPTVILGNRAVPTTVAAILTTFEPTVSIAAGGVTVTPTTAALSTSAFAPTIALSDHQRVTPSTAALSDTGLAPTIAISDHQRVTPTTASLTAAAFAPVVALGIVPATRAATTATFAPAVSTPVLVTPATASLADTTFAPTVTTSDHVRVTPTTASLSAASFAPVVVTPQTITPATRAATLATFAPNVGQPVEAMPSTLAVALATFAPGVTITEHVRVTPGPVTAVLLPLAPVVVTPQTITIPSRALTTTTFAPTVGTAEAPVGLPDDLVVVVGLVPIASATVTIAAPSAGVILEPITTAEVTI